MSRADALDQRREPAGAAEGVCDEYGRGALKAAKARGRIAREYLADGLYEECRKAPDCQPGYLR